MEAGSQEDIFENNVTQKILMKRGITKGSYKYHNAAKTRSQSLMGKMTTLNQHQK